MTTESEIIPLKHPLIAQTFYWNEELWFDHNQLTLLFPNLRSRLKRLLRQWVTYRSEAQSHTHQFSVVKMRKSAKSEAKSEWLYQIRCYDTWFIKKLLAECESEDARLLLKEAKPLIYK